MTERIVENDWWPFIVLILATSLVAIGRQIYSARLLELWNVLLFRNAFFQRAREERTRHRTFSNVLGLNFLLTTSTLGGLILEKYAANYEFLVWTGICAAALIAIRIVSVVVNQVLIFFAGSAVGYAEHTLNTSVTRNAIGIVLLPFAWIMAFAEMDERMHLYLLVSCGVIPALFFIYRTLRGVLITLESGASFLYIILYLCTLEILPLVVSVRWLITRNA